MLFRLVPKSSTLDDFELLNVQIASHTFWYTYTVDPDLHYQAARSNA